MILLKTFVEHGIVLYRKTLKRWRRLHGALYKIIRVILVPQLEKLTDFYTASDDPLWFRIELITGNYEKDTVKFVQQFINPGHSCPKTVLE